MFHNSTCTTDDLKETAQLELVSVHAQTEHPVLHNHIILLATLYGGGKNETLDMLHTADCVLCSYTCGHGHFKYKQTEIRSRFLWDMVSCHWVNGTQWWSHLLASKTLHILSPECATTTPSRIVGQQWPNGAAPHSRRTKTWTATLLRRVCLTSVAVEKQ